MTSGCVLRRCRNSYAHVNKNSGISYHTFPSNPFMKEKWICIVRAERSECDWKPTTCSKICSEHFKEEDKYITCKGGIRLLKKTAVPVIPGMSISINTLETQSIQIRPYSNAERQKRYRERKRADQMKSCSTSSESSDVQQQTQNNVINKNVDPVEHARNARKRHLNKLRQSRFRARQRFKSPCTSSQQAQELVTQEKYVVHDRHQDVLEDLHSSDPIHSTDSCLLTNIAWVSLTRETHIEKFTEDVTAMKEEPGSPLSDISIHSDAVDSPEEQEIKNTLRKKIKMLNENEEILKRRCEEASILENKHKELLADIKFLQNMFKKKC